MVLARGTKCRYFLSIYLASFFNNIAKSKYEQEQDNTLGGDLGLGNKMR